MDLIAHSQAGEPAGFNAVVSVTETKGPPNKMSTTVEKWHY